MGTVSYIAIGMVILTGAAYLFTQFLHVLRKQSRTTVDEISEHQVYPDIEDHAEISLRVPMYSERFPAMKKEFTHHVRVNTHLL